MVTKYRARRLCRLVGGKKKRNPYLSLSAKKKKLRGEKRSERLLSCLLVKRCHEREKIGQSTGSTVLVNTRKKKKKDKSPAINSPREGGENELEKELPAGSMVRAERKREEEVDYVYTMEGGSRKKMERRRGIDVFFPVNRAKRDEVLIFFYYVKEGREREGIKADGTSDRCGVGSTERKGGTRTHPHLSSLRGGTKKKRPWGGYARKNADRQA